MGFVAPKEERVKGGFVAPASDLQEEKPGLLKRADLAAGNVVKTGLDVLAAPFEVAGEALRLPMEGKPLSDFRAPTIIQRLRDNPLDAANPPADPFAQINKGVRATAGAIQNLPHGLDAAKEGAKAAYNADRGALGQVEDVALSLAGGKFSNAPMDIAIKGGRNLALALGLDKVGPAVSKFGKAAGKKAISSTLGPSIEAVDARFKNPAAIRAAEDKHYLDIADDAGKGLDQLGLKISEADGKAYKTLSVKESLAEGAVPKEKLIEDLGKTIRSLEVEGTGPVGPAQEKAIGILHKIKDRIFQVGEQPKPLKTEIVEWDTSGLVPQKVTRNVVEEGDPRKTGISEKALKEVIRQLDDNIDWDDPKAGVINEALQGLRTGWDMTLKGRNKAYEKSMRPVAAMTRTMDETKGLLGFQKDRGAGIVPGNNTEGIIKNIAGETRAQARKTLGKLKAYTGVDVGGESKKVSLAKQFKGGVTQGSRRTTPFSVIGSQIGGALGGALAGWPGAGIGGTLGAGLGFATGAHVDIKGREMAGTLIDKLVRMSHRASPFSSVSPAFRKVLEASGVLAAARGK